jgi:hypothetical protein
MTPQLGALPLALLLALWPALHLDQQRDIWGRARQSAPVLVWSQAARSEVEMLAPLAARCRQDMTLFMRNA